MIILVMSWNTSTTAQVWLSWFCHKFVMDVHAWQKTRPTVTNTYHHVSVFFFVVSLFDSQYHVLLDVLGDLFDVIFFCDVFAEIRWIMDLWSSLSMNIIWISSEFLYAWFDIFVILFELSVWFGQLHWFFLQWEKCLALGSILRCPFPVTVGAPWHVLYCWHRGLKDGVYIILLELIPLHHVIILNALLHSLWHGVIVADAESFRSIWHGRDSYIHDQLIY